jgi:SAM-dependent methyltransferase
MEWFADEDFWRDLYPAMFPPERFAAADQQVSHILDLIRFQGRTILDLCCGPGRHSVSFAQHGFKVTGVDLSEFLLERARERAREFGVEVEWIREDMRQFERPKAFDLACSLFTSFGYFQDEQDDLKVLRNVRACLVPGGVFVIETLGKERLARAWQSALCDKLQDGSLVLQRPQVRADWTRVRNEWVLIKDNHSKSFHFEHSIYSGRELKDRLLQAGFGQVNLYGDLEGKPYGLDAIRLVAVAHNT